jgi:transposase
MWSQSAGQPRASANRIRAGSVLPENLPRIEEVVPCREQSCKQCGAETALIGYDESEQLDVEPARYFVRVVKREKRACQVCREGAVAMPELTPRIIDKGLASDRVVIQTVVAKYSVVRRSARESRLMSKSRFAQIRSFPKRLGIHKPTSLHDAGRRSELGNRCVGAARVRERCIRQGRSVSFCNDRSAVVTSAAVCE